MDLLNYYLKNEGLIIRSLFTIFAFLSTGLLFVFSGVNFNSVSLWAFLSIQNYVNKKQSYFGGGGGQPGTLTISDIIQEKNVIQVIGRKVKKLINLVPQMSKLLSSERRVIISTQSAISAHEIQNNSIDYVFTDPPFGRNLMYSELNLLIKPG